MVDIRFSPGSASSGNGKDQRAYTVISWDLEDVVVYVSQKLGSKTIEMSSPGLNPSSIYTSEGETNTVCVGGLCWVVVRVGGVNVC